MITKILMSIIIFWVISVNDFQGFIQLSQEHSEYKWLSLKEIKKQDVTPAVWLHFNFKPKPQ